MIPCQTHTTKETNKKHNNVTHITSSILLIAEWVIRGMPSFSLVYYIYINSKCCRFGAYKYNNNKNIDVNDELVVKQGVTEGVGQWCRRSLCQSFVFNSWEYPRDCLTPETPLKESCCIFWKIIYFFFVAHNHCSSCKVLYNRTIGWMCAPLS